MMNGHGSKPRKVLLVEFNEITWRILDPLCGRGRLPTFAAFLEHGARGTPIAVEEPPHLDPWISWTTLYTGRPQDEHGVKFLEQPPETVTGPRLADLAADAGKTLGIYGSIMHWPPRRDIKGFWVPSTFSPGPETFPETLRPIQELNLSQTRAHTPLAGRQRQGFVGRALKLMTLGLKPTTALAAAARLLSWKRNPDRQWEKVSLQPLINLDFFERAYRRYRPDFATFHSNHVAHYMHRYWRAYDPTPFLKPPSAEEVRRFGDAIPFGYEVADRCLKRLWKLADDGQTVLAVASGLGQQPYVVEDFPEGRQVMRIKDIRQLVDLCGLTGHCEPISMMAPQWNIKVPDPERRAAAERVLAEAWAGQPSRRLYAFESVGDTLCVNIYQKNFADGIDLAMPCQIGNQTFRLGDLCAVQDATPKEGYHDRAGLLLLRGPGIRPGAQLDHCTNLDIAPTLLTLLGLPVPPHMKGRVLEEAFTTNPRVAVPA